MGEEGKALMEDMVDHVLKGVQRKDYLVTHQMPHIEGYPARDTERGLRPGLIPDT